MKAKHLKGIMKIAVVFVSLGLLAVCDLSVTGTGELEQMDYFSKVLKYYTDIDDDYDTEQMELVLEKEFDSTKDQVVETEHVYEDGIKTTTNIYTFDSAGVKPENPTEYILYTYLDAADCDSDGDGTDDILGLRRISVSETYNREEEKTSKDEVLYDGDVTDSYYKIKTYSVENETETLSSEQRVTYYKGTDPDYNGEKRTEQNFLYDSTDGYTLNKETAFWYNDDGTVSHELVHVLRGEENTEEVHLYKPYSYTEDGKIYLVSDYTYDSGTVPGGGDDGSFTLTPGNNDPFSYDIEFESIGIQKNMTLNDYNERGLISKEKIYTQGEIQEVRTYVYNDQDELVSESRYLGGGSVLEEKKVIRFREETINNRTYVLKEVITYRFSSETGTY